MLQDQLNPPTKKTRAAVAQNTVEKGPSVDHKRENQG